MLVQAPQPSGSLALCGLSSQLLSWNRYDSCTNTIMAISTKAMPSAYVAPNRYQTTATPSSASTMRKAAGTQNSNFGFIRDRLYFSDNM